MEGNPLAVALHLVGPPTMLHPATNALIPSPYAGRVFEATIVLSDKFPFAFPADVLWKLTPEGKSTLFHPLVGSDGSAAGGAAGAGLSGAPMCTAGFQEGWGPASSLAMAGGLASKIYDALVQPCLPQAPNQEALGLLTGPAANVEEYVRRARAACAGLPAAEAGH